jgi:hypothetical protein
VVKSSALVLIVLFLSIPLLAQKGTAPSGYYPANYFGRIFTGVVEPAPGAADEITLVYTKGNTSEKFTGRLESKCSMLRVDGVTIDFTASELPKGTILTAFYTPTTTRSSGKKSTENLIFAIEILQVRGREFLPKYLKAVRCSQRQFSEFKPFSSTSPGAIVPPP